MTTTLINTIQDPGLTLSNVAQSTNSSTRQHPSTLPAKLSGGWHHTERWGEVFVAPGGSSWVVQQSGDRLINVTIKLNSPDIVQRPAIERVKRASAERRRYNSIVARK